MHCYENVWSAIEPSVGAAAGLKARAGLMIALAGTIRRRGWTQRQAARRFGVAEPRVSDLMRGRIRLFSLDTLVEMVALACLRPRLPRCRALDRPARLWRRHSPSTNFAPGSVPGGRSIKRRFFAVLHTRVISSPVVAARATIVAEHRRK